MAKDIHKLNARQVTTTNTPGRYSDGAGLYLHITNIEQKRWVLRYTPSPGAKPREMGLGSAGSGGISLAQARELARHAVKQGDDPIRQRQIQVQKEDVSVPMFGVFADEYIETQASNFRNDKHIAQWRMPLTKYAKPIRRKPIDEITTDDILSILNPIWKSKHETANQTARAYRTRS